MNLLKAIWNERTNILSFLNTTAIALVAYVLWVKIPFASHSQNFSSDLSAQSESIDKLTERLDHPLSVTIANPSNGLNGLFEGKVPFIVNVGGKVDATVEGKSGLAPNPVKVEATGNVNVKATVEGGSQFNPVHISNP